MSIGSFEVHQDLFKRWLALQSATHTLTLATFMVVQMDALHFCPETQKAQSQIHRMCF